MEYSKVSDKEWEEIILKSDNSSFHNSPLWAKVMEKTHNYRTATRLYDINGKEILIPMMELNLNKFGLKRVVSMPGNNDGGIFSESEITTDDSKAIVNDIVGGRNLSLIINLLSKESFSQLKEEWKYKDDWNYTHILDLEGKTFEDIWKNYNGKTRTSIRKAEKTGVEVRDATSLNDFKIFYDIFSNASKKWGLETPPEPFQLLENVYKYGSDHVELSLAIKDDKIIAGLLSFLYSKTVNLYMSAFLPEYGTFNPKRMLYSESIEYACQEGCEYLNMGPSGNIDHIGNFKEEFGAEKVEINKYRVHSNLAKILNKINNLRNYSK
ncbi:MAG: peptidoglycan bridge formation glycyltransferase FemA/FemB family protein [Methanobacterium sp.]